MKRKTGFTIIELLVVISIIGILIAIVQATVTNAAAKTYEYQCESRLRQIGVAMNAYSQDYGAFPATLDKVDALIQDRTVLGCPRTDHRVLVPAARPKRRPRYRHRRLRQSAFGPRATSPQVRQRISRTVRWRKRRAGKALANRVMLNLFGHPHAPAAELCKTFGEKCARNPLTWV